MAILGGSERIIVGCGLEANMDPRTLTTLAEEVCSPKSTPSTLTRHLEEKLPIPAEAYKDGLDAILLWACRKGWVELVRWFVEHFNSSAVNAPVRYHLEDKGVTYVSYRLSPYCLVEQRNRVKCRDIRSDTLLHAAVAGGCCKTVLYLLQAGAAVDAVNCCVKTPLIIACQLCQVDVCSLLLEYGAHVNHQDNRGYTPLMHVCSARKMGHLSSTLTDLLLQSGADPLIPNEQGHVVLHVAVAHRNAYALQALVANGYLPIKSPNDCSSLWVSGHHLYELLPEGNFTSICQVITSCSKCLPCQRAEMYLLLATLVFESSLAISHLDSCKKILKKSFEITPLHAFTQSSFRVHPIYEPHFFRVKNLEDLTQLFSSSPSTVYERIAYLCLVARECLLGPHSLCTVLLIFKVGRRLLFHNPADLTQTLNLWLRGSVMLKACINLSGPDVDYARTNSLLFVLRGPMTYLASKVCLQIPQSSSLVETVTAIVGNVLSCVAQYLSSLNGSHSHSPSHKVISQTSLVEESVKILYWLWLLSRKHAWPIDSVADLGRKFACVCPRFVYRDLWSSNLLHFSIVSSLPAGFIEAVLRWGADQYVNVSLGPWQNRPLHYCSLKVEVALLLLEFGAHFDAVNRTGRTAFEQHRDGVGAVSECFSQFRPPPLACLAAKAILQHKINYQLLTYPSRLKVFIGFHDPDT